MAAEHRASHAPHDAPTTEEIAAILEAVARLEHPRRELITEFTRAALRRAPAHMLALNAETVAERMQAAFDAMDRRRNGDVAVQILGDVTSAEHDVTLQVVCEDRPLLLSTVRAEVQAAGCAIHGTFHPIIGVERAADGSIAEVTPARHAPRRESVVHIEITSIAQTDVDPLLASLRDRVEDLRVVTDAHEAMRNRIAELADGLAGLEDDVDATRTASLLRWLLDDNIVILGVSDQRGTALGIFSDPRFARLHPPTRADDAWLTVSRSASLSPVQRHSPVELFDVTSADGDRVVIGGLFTRKGTTEPALAIELLRHRLLEVFEAQDVVEGSHDAVVLTSLFQAIPKDELLRCDSTELDELLATLYRAEEYRDIRVMLRHHGHAGDVSVLVAAPRDRWTTTLRTRIEDELTRRFDARWLDTDLSVTDRREILARFLLQPGEEAGAPTQDQLAEVIIALAAPWEETARQRLHERDEVDQVRRRRAARLVDAMPISYRERTDPAHAVDDLLLLQQAATGEQSLVLALHTAAAGEPTPLRLRAAKRGEPLELSAFNPILESLGVVVVDEVPHRLATVDGQELTLHDFGLRSPHLDADRDAKRFTDTVMAAWRGHFEVDPLNQLVVVADLSWRDVTLLRTYRRLRRQLGSRYTATYVQGILAQHPEVVRALVEYFHARFDPARVTDDAGSLARDAVIDALNGLQRLDHDRVFRGLLSLIDATLRTNAFRADAFGDDGEPYIALKFDPSRIPGIPTPLPYREIFVHSPRFEGVHLRAGAVARGGIRWSDRLDDVRTEVLDLMKAQVLKNSVIVPTGAKGGFVIADEPEDPEQRRAEVRRQYITFVRGLLDVTDDLEGEQIVPPPNVVRRDGDDPYLVVAADRGTATFSDTANGLAEGYGFWLGDAFASGGSQGYDHKKLGVTARGAWVAIRRHFRELGLDADVDPITVAGVGDMSGDVFGNGLLRSRSVRLVAAFDHRHIFLDPDPDPEASFDERQRLFDLPRSSWDDYDRAVLSEGGMIVDRSVRSIELGDAVRRVLRIDDEQLSPPELIQAILRAPVDLLFAGGIGTYVKASVERNEDVGDRTNDELRVDASNVRARVIGEGANLFITQRGRIELAKRGSRLNQDAVDNAAGVATSDLEVNLKILFRLAEQRGELTHEERNTVLADLTGDVVEQVLATVDQQAAAISRELVRSPHTMDAYQQLMHHLETTSELHRDDEVLPDAEELERRSGSDAGLTRPELATLVAWAKRDLKEALLATPFPESELWDRVLDHAFLPRVRERFGHLIPQHRLRRELIATSIANDVVNRLGVTFTTQLASELECDVTDVIHAFLAVRSVLDADRWWGHLDELDATQEPARVRELEAPLEELIGTLTRVMISDPTAPSPDELVEGGTHVASVILDGVSTLGTPDQRRGRTAHARWLIDDLVDPDLARFLASVRDLTLTLDVTAVRRRLTQECSDADIVDVLLRVDAELETDRLDEALQRAGRQAGWGHRQRVGLSMDLRRARRAAAVDVLGTGRHPSNADAVAAWGQQRSEQLERSRGIVRQAVMEGHRTTDALAVAARQVRETVEYVPR